MEPEAHIRSVLEPGEDLLWTGEPLGGLRVNTSGKTFWLLVGILAAFSAIVTTQPLTKEDGTFTGSFIVAGTLFFVALFFFVFPVLFDAYDRRRVAYGMTDSRAIIVDRKFGGKTRRFPLDAFRSISIGRHWDGRATICAAIDAPAWPSTEAGNPLSHPLFRHIDDTAALYAQLIALRPDLRSDHESLSADDEAYLGRLLQPDEQLLWWERPPSGLRRHGNDLLQTLMALVLIIVPIVCIKAVLDTRDVRREGIGEVGGVATTFIIVAGVLLMLKGMHLLVMRYFRDAGKRNSALYALTTQRAIVAKHPNEYGTSARSIWLASVTDVDIAWERNDRGTISCRGEAVDWKIPNAKKGGYQKLRAKGPLFRGIKCPERVVALMADSRGASSPRTPLAVFTGSSSAARLDRLPGERIKWLGTSDDARNSNWITAWSVRFSIWTKDLLKLLGVPDQVARRQTSVLHSLPVHTTRTLEYLLTDRRVVILDPDYEHGVRRIPLDSLDQLFLQTDRHGNEMIFARSSVRDWPYRDGAGNSIAGPLFPGIDDPATVFAMMADAYPAFSQQDDFHSVSTAERQIRHWLRDHESLIWTGRPLPARPMSRSDFWFFALLIAYSIIAATLVGRAWQRQSSFIGEAGSIPPLSWGLLGAGAAAFLVYGLYQTHLRFVVDPHAWKSTVYGLTDRRVIVQTDRWIQSVPLHRLGYIDLEIQERRKGSLACRIGSASWLVFDELAVRSEQAWPFDGYLFKDICDPKEVASLIATTRWTPHSRMT